MRKLPYKAASVGFVMLGGAGMLILNGCATAVKGTSQTVTVKTIPPGAICTLTQKDKVIAVVNPVAMALLKPPGRWGENGADIAVGEGQPLGVPLSSGGPYFGYMTCKQKHVRQMPGRIVGRTVDLDGREGFVLTLQAREQHIRRSKATSNICTNQGLVVTASTIYMSIMGAEGLENTAAACHANNNMLVEKLAAIDGVKKAFSATHFHETVLQLEKPAAEVLAALLDNGILGGYDLANDYPELGDAILVCTTEMRSEEDIQAYADAMQQTMAATSLEELQESA